MKCEWAFAHFPLKSDGFSLMVQSETCAYHSVQSAAISSCGCWVNGNGSKSQRGKKKSPTVQWVDPLLELMLDQGACLRAWWPAAVAECLPPSLPNGRPPLESVSHQLSSSSAAWRFPSHKAKSGGGWDVTITSKMTNGGKKVRRLSY